MTLVTFPRFIKHGIFLLSVASLLSACGGSDDKKSSDSSSSSSSVSSHTFIPTPIVESGTGIWPSIKVSATNTKVLQFQWSEVVDTTSYKLLKKADATSAYEQVGADITTPVSAGIFTASDAVSVHLTDWVNSRYKVQACDSLNVCVDSTEIAINSAMLTAVTYLKASNAGANDWFGWSVALSGDGQTLAIGAPAEDSNAIGINQDQISDTSPNSGAVYIFTKVADEWVQQAYIKASNTEQPNDNSNITLANDRFGYQIAISTDGNTLAVSALLEDSPSRGIDCYQTDYEYTASSASSTTLVHQSFNTGAVYIFKREATEWSQTTYVKPHNPLIEGRFGNTLSISGDGKTLAVGTQAESTYGAGIQDLRSASSSECIDFSISSDSTSSSSTVSSSATSNSSLLGGSNSGAVYLFKETDTGWIEEAFIKASDAGINDYFGGSVSLSTDGSLLAVGAIGDDGKDSASTTNDTITFKNVTYALDNGGVYVFANTNDAWTQQAKLKPYNNGFNQQFGFSVALAGDGNSLAVGAPGDWSKARGIENITAGVIGPLASDYNLEADVPTFKTGAVYIFTKEATTWTATTYLKASNSQPIYQFGNSVSLSADGSVLAIGSLGESSQATGINGDQLDMASESSGAVYVFTTSGSTWEQKSYVKATNTAGNHRFGGAVKLDDSGNALAIGAHREGDNTDPLTTATGAVYIF